MVEKIRKPKVFLSHSRSDEGFVKRIEADLRLAQIDPWLDVVEIRHGKPFLKVIFEEGIPTCDVLLVYFTQNSLKSEMVKREIDAGIVSQLEDNSMSFLPYVSDEELRKKMRSDIRTIQCPEWNERNYLELLPVVVSEIWRSYSERIVHLATVEEKSKRFQAQLEVERLKKEVESSIFSKAEHSDFSFMVSRLHQLDNYTIEFEEILGKEKKRGRDTVRLPQMQVLLTTLKRNLMFNDYMFRFVIKDLAQSLFANQSNTMNNKTYIKLIHPEVFQRLLYELQTFGLVERTNNDVRASEKFFRFRYWLLEDYKWEDYDLEKYFDDPDSPVKIVSTEYESK